MMKYFFQLTLVLWTLTVNGQMFTKITNSPLSTTPGDSRSVNWVDVNSDGFVDCFISNGPQSGQNNMLYINDGSGHFIAVNNDPIVMDNMPSDGATFADIDNDGDLDGFVVNWYNKNNLAYINDGSGNFTQVLDGIWVNHFGYSETAAFGDYDNDGKVDLYVTNSAGTKKNFLYKNLGNHEMELIIGIPPVTELHSSRSVNWTDIDMDGDLDLYVTNENGEKEDVYRNDGAGIFEKLTGLEIIADGYNTMSSSWGDIDNDGDLDLFLANDGAKNQLFRNEGQFQFTRVTDTDISLATANSFSSAWADIDNDGDLDLFVTNAFKSGVRLKNNLYLNDGAGHFTAVTDDPVVMDEGWSYGCAFGDYDNDGFQDLAVATTRFGNTDEPDYLYHNNGNGNHWLLIALEGTTSNQSAIGTKVRVKATINGKGTWQMREISAQSAYCGQNDMRAHFGVGQSLLIDSVRIEWPSGIVQILSSVPADQIINIREEMVSSVIRPSAPFDLNVYPNPTDDHIRVNAKFRSQVNQLHLEVVGDTGQVLYHESFEQVQTDWVHELNLRQLQLSPGVYFIKLHNGVESVERKILLIR